MESSLISVVIPAYNAGCFLPDCLDSLVKQKYTNWEAVLVDDGSTDDSLAICEEYARKDSRIRVFHKENGGVSRARNYGIEKARGGWITFMDADDTISSDYFPEKLDQDVDMYVTGVTYIGDEIMSESIPPARVAGKDYLSFLGEHAHKTVFTAPWGKIIRKEIITANHISFNPRFRVGEDTLFVLQLEKFCRTIIVKEGYYLYRYDSYDSWVKKYSLSPIDALSYLHHFGSYYDSAGISCPKLVSAVLGSISQMTDYSSFSHWRWKLQPQVVRMIGRSFRNMTFVEKCKYEVRIILSKAYLLFSAPALVIGSVDTIGLDAAR